MAETADPLPAPTYISTPANEDDDDEEEDGDGRMMMIWDQGRYWNLNWKELECK